MPRSPSNDPTPDQFIEIGRVLRPWGLLGDLRIQVLTDFPERFQQPNRLYIQGASYVIEGSRPHQGALLLKLKGIDSLEAAEGLRGALFQIPEAEAHPLPKGTFFQYQVVGLRVVTEKGEDLGEVVEVLSTGGNDVYVTQGPQGQVMVPAIEDVVKAVDLEKGVITVEALPGLL